MLKKIVILLSGLLLLGLPVGAFQFPPVILFGAVQMTPQGTTTQQGNNDEQGAFWLWATVMAEPFTGCDDLLPTSPILLSPRQRMVAYTSTPELWKPHMEEGWSGADFPTDIAICDLGSGKATIIAAQPPNATIEDGLDGYYASRSEPTWSPDGTQLAWAEYIGDTLQLLVYDFPTATTSVLVPDLNLDKIEQLGMTPHVSWSEAGIGVENFTGFETYSPAGELLSRISLPQYSSFQFWITYTDKTYMAYYDTTGDWYLGDPLTGAVELMPGLPELYVPGNANSLTVRYNVQINPPPNDRTPPYAQPRWWVIQDGQAFPLELEAHPGDNRITISPYGLMVAYIYEDRLWQWSDGEVSLAAGAENLTFKYAVAPSLAWIPLAWRVAAAD